jgi:acetyl-CoA acyltransferase
MRDAVIAAAVRTPVGKAPKGALRHVRPDTLAALAVREAVARVPGLDPAQVDDVVLGCAFPEAEQGLNLGRVVALGAGLPTRVAGMTVNRYCASGLEAIAIAAHRVREGLADVVVAGGVESMSRVPAVGYRPSPHPQWARSHPEYYVSMGHTAEEVARRYGVRREDQDAYALESHRRAAVAQDEGRFDAELVAVPLEADNGRPLPPFTRDEGVRRDTSLEKLSQLRPAFAQDGTVTAGNSSQTSDGAAAVVVMGDDVAARMGLTPLGIFRAYRVYGVDPEIMGIGPVEAVPRALQAAGLHLSQVDLVELNEAFASQTLAVMRALDLDPERVNVNGGAIALGHPLGATGAKLTATLLYEMARRQSRYGVVTMCVGGGMGAAGVWERP